MRSAKPPGPIVSHKRKYLYFYIPKAACTTIRKILAEDEGIPWYPNWTVSEKGEHLTAPFCRMSLEESKKLDYYRFGFVRNPWTRLVSCYLDKVVKVREMPDNLFVKNGQYRRFLERYGSLFKGMSFADFVDFVERTPDSNADGHFRSQYTFFPKKMDAVGKVETLLQDLAEILSTAGVPDYVVTREHSSQIKDYSQYYNKKLYEKVAQRFAIDIQQFGYSDEAL